MFFNRPLCPLGQLGIDNASREKLNYVLRSLAPLATPLPALPLIYPTENRGGIAFYANAVYPPVLLMILFTKTANDQPPAKVSKFVNAV